jgi:hypothetical protein
MDRPKTASEVMEYHFGKPWYRYSNPEVATVRVDEPISAARERLRDYLSPRPELHRLYRNDPVVNRSLTNSSIAGSSVEQALIQLAVDMHTCMEGIRETAIALAQRATRIST